MSQIIMTELDRKPNEKFKRIIFLGVLLRKPQLKDRIRFDGVQTIEQNIRCPQQVDGDKARSAYPALLMWEINGENRYARAELH